MKRILRSLAAILAAPAMVVLYLNIEVWAAERGLDKLLSKYVPDFTIFVSQTWVYSLALMAIGFSAGIWADKFTRIQPKKKTRQQDIGRRCKALANYINDDLRGMRPLGSVAEAMSQYEMLQYDFGSLGLELPNCTGDPIEFFRAIAPALERYAPYLLRNRLKDLKATVRKNRQVTSENSELPRMKGNGERTPH